MRRLPLLPAFLLVLTAATVAGAAELPAATAARLARALESLEKDTSVGGYTMTLNATVSKPDGSDREDQLEVLKATRGPEGRFLHEVVRSEENGKDVTAKRRAEQAKHERREAEKAGKEKQEASISVSLKLPAGDDMKLFAFSPAPSGDPHAVAFAPLPAHRKVDGMARGTVAWDPVTSDPLWLEAEPVEMPDHVSAMKLRFEFARSGELLYPRRTITDGAGGMLWIKRKFHMEMDVTDVVPAALAPAP